MKKPESPASQALITKRINTLVHKIRDQGGLTLQAFILSGNETTSSELIINAASY